MPQHTSTAVLLFAKTVLAEQRSKQLLAQKSSNNRLLGSLLKHSTNLIAGSGFAHYHSNEFDQVGSTFGEKLSNAIADVFEKGHDQVIIIGSDCPELTLKDIFTAEKLLERKKFVIGPDTRGGAYLIGIRKQDFEFQSFSKLNWNTSKTRIELEAYGRGSQSLLSEKSDLNVAKDTRVLANISKLFRTILVDICDGVTWTYIHILSYTSSHKTVLSRRGPPIMTSSF